MRVNAGSSAAAGRLRDSPSAAESRAKICRRSGDRHPRAERRRRVLKLHRAPGAQEWEHGQLSDARLVGFYGTSTAPEKTLSVWPSFGVRTRR